MAERLLKAGKVAEAEAQAKAAVDAAADLGERHSTYHTALELLVSTLVADTRFQEAEPLAQKLVNHRKGLLGPLHPSTLKSMRVLAHVLVSQQKLCQAEPVMFETVSACRTFFGDDGDHPETLAASMGLAQVLGLHGKLQEARPLMLANLVSARAIHGEMSEEALIALSNLAQCLADQGHVGDAEPMLRDYLRACQQVYGPPKTACRTRTAVMRLADVLEAQERITEATSLVVKHFGSKHPRAIGLIRLLAARKHSELCANEDRDMVTLVR